MLRLHLIDQQTYCLHHEYVVIAFIEFTTIFSIMLAWTAALPAWNTSGVSGDFDLDWWNKNRVIPPTLALHLLFIFYGASYQSLAKEGKIQLTTIFSFFCLLQWHWYIYIVSMEVKCGLVMKSRSVLGRENYIWACVAFLGTQKLRG